MEATQSGWEKIEEKEKKKIEKFGGDVIVLIPTPPTSSLYILIILAKISEVIHLIKEINDRGNMNIQLKLHFLMLIDAIKTVESIKTPLIDHYKYVVNDVGKNIDTLTQIRYHEFQSLVNNFLMSLEGLSDIERRKLISHLEYHDIKDYTERKKIKTDDTLTKFLKGVKSEIDIMGMGKMDDAVFNSFFTSFYGTEKCAMNELLTILFKWDRNCKILIVMDDARNIIENTTIWEKGIEQKEKVAFANYFNPLKVFKGSPLPSFSNLLSMHINEESGFDYKKHKKFLYQIIDELKSGLFSTGGEEEKTLTDEEIKEIINKGFLSIQNSIIQQLSTII